MGFWRGLRWGFVLGIIAALVGRVVSGPNNEEQWQQAKVAGDIAAAKTESEQREKFNKTRKGTEQDS